MAARTDHHLAAFVARPPARLALADLPTPVERAPWLDGGGVEVWVKRDDCTSALYGGGKVRKLEWLLASETYAGDRPIVSLGGVGSHHLLALGLHLKAQGRELHALTFDQVPTPHVRATLAATLTTGARLWSVRSRLQLPWAWLGYRLWARPERPGLLPRPAAVYMTGGSAASSAGLVLGLALAGVSTHLRVVAAVERWILGGRRWRGMVQEIWQELVAAGLHPELAAGGWRGLLARRSVTWSIDHGHVGPGYAVPTSAGESLVALAERHGLMLETTYTGKCAAALRADIASGRCQGPVLLWNTHANTDLGTLARPGWHAGLPLRLRGAHAPGVSP